MRLSSLLSPILITILISSPLMAQDPPVPNLKMNTAGQYYDTSLVGTSILMSLPSRSEAASMPAAPQRDSNSPGKTKSAIIPILIGAGIITAVILLLSGGDDDEPVPMPVAAPVTPAPAPVPVGTILAAGPPTVNSPNQ
jgi:hypothetical protein